MHDSERQTPASRIDRIMVLYRALQSISRTFPADLRSPAASFFLFHMFIDSVSFLSSANSICSLQWPSRVIASEISVKIGFESPNWLVKQSTLFWAYSRRRSSPASLASEASNMALLNSIERNNVRKLRILYKKRRRRIIW
jgi:hypothetical protein